MKKIILHFAFFICLSLNAQSTLSNNEFEIVRKEFNNLNSDYRKAKECPTLFKGLIININQLKVLLNTIGSDYYKNECAKNLVNHVSDCNKSILLKSEFSSNYYFQNTKEFYDNNCKQLNTSTIIIISHDELFGTNTNLTDNEFNIIKNEINDLSSDYTKAKESINILKGLTINMNQLNEILKTISSDYYKFECAKNLISNISDCNKSILLKPTFSSSYYFQNTKEFYDTNCK